MSDSDHEHLFAYLSSSSKLQPWYISTEIQLSLDAAGWPILDMNCQLCLIRFGRLNRALEMIFRRSVAADDLFPGTSLWASDELLFRNLRTLYLNPSHLLENRYNYTLIRSPTLPTLLSSRHQAQKLIWYQIRQRWIDNFKIIHFSVHCSL